MSEFNRHYIVLSIFTIAALACVIYSSRGGDPSYGSFGSGLAVGVLTAFYFLRRAELHLLSQGKIETEEVGSPTETTPFIDTKMTEDRAQDEHHDFEPPADGPDSFLEEVDHAPMPVEGIPEQARPVVARCACVCGCTRRSISGDVELCGNCHRWWVQQSERCECDFSTQDFCDCGAINHGIAV